MNNLDTRINNLAELDKHPLIMIGVDYKYQLSADFSEAVSIIGMLREENIELQRKFNLIHEVCHEGLLQLTEAELAKRVLQQALTDTNDGGAANE